MESMNAITEPFGLDPNGNAVVTVFLGNSMGWRGEIARRIRKSFERCVAIRRHRCHDLSFLVINGFI